MLLSDRRHDCASSMPGLRVLIEVRQLVSAEDIFCSLRYSAAPPKWADCIEEGLARISSRLENPLQELHLDAKETQSRLDVRRYQAFTDAAPWNSADAALQGSAESAQEEEVMGSTTDAGYIHASRWTSLLFGPMGWERYSSGVHNQENRASIDPRSFNLSRMELAQHQAIH